MREGQRGDYWGARIDPRTALPGFIQSVHTIPIVLGPGVVSSRIIDYLLSIEGMIVSGTRGIEDACPLMICAAMHDGSATKQAWKTFQETFHHPSIPSSGLLAVYATF